MVQASPCRSGLYGFRGSCYAFSILCKAIGMPVWTLWEYTSKYYLGKELAKY